MTKRKRSRKLDVDGKPKENPAAEVHPKDKGCELAKTCVDCPYRDGQVKYTCKCKYDYPKGVRSLVAESRDSLIYSLYINGYSATILARIFNIAKPTVRAAIHYYLKGEYASKSKGES